MGAEITRRDLKGPCNVLIAFHYLSMYTEQNVLLKKKKEKKSGTALVNLKKIYTVVLLLGNNAVILHL